MKIGAITLSTKLSFIHKLHHIKTVNHTLSKADLGPCCYSGLHIMTPFYNRIPFITITILLWVLSIYPFIKHYIIVVLS